MAVAVNNVECTRRPPPYSVTWVCTKIFSTSSPFPITKFNWGVEQVSQVFVLLMWGEEKYRQIVKAVMPDFCFCNIIFYCRMGLLLAFVSTALFPRTIPSRGCNSSLIFDLEKKDLWFLQLCFNVSVCILSGKVVVSPALEVFQMWLAKCLSGIVYVQLELPEVHITCSSSSCCTTLL